LARECQDDSTAGRYEVLYNLFLSKHNQPNAIIIIIIIITIIHSHSYFCTESTAASFIKELRDSTNLQEYSDYYSEILYFTHFCS